jgi:hypothetical protein
LDETLEPSPQLELDRRLAWFTVLWTSATIVLVGLTWRLWTGTSDFPQVPLFSWLVDFPPIVDQLLSAGLMISCIILLTHSIGFICFQAIACAVRINFSRKTRVEIVTAATWLFIVSLAGLFLLNQHRLQPWAWQFMLYALIAVVTSGFQSAHGPHDQATAAAKDNPRVFGVRSNDCITAARWFTASIYFHSAIGKFDYQFIHGLGRQLAEAGLELLGLGSILRFDLLPVSMPAFELAIAIVLLIAPLKKWGVIMAVVFHGTLLVTLGPWGMNHHTGVLVWNLFFAAITTVLFWPYFFAGPSTAESTPDKSLVERLPITIHSLILTTILVGYPLLPMCDHWLAWGLYSPNNSRADLEVIRPNEAEVSRFDRVDLGAKSLQALNIPLYPEARFQLGVAIAIEQSGELQSPCRIIIRSRSDRFTGKRESIDFSPTRWQRSPVDFFFNWHPRAVP